MRAGEVELVDPDGKVIATGQLREWMLVEASAVPVTACVDLGPELVLIAVPPSGQRALQFRPPEDGWPEL